MEVEEESMFFLVHFFGGLKKLGRLFHKCLRCFKKFMCFGWKMSKNTLLYYQKHSKTGLNKNKKTLLLLEESLEYRETLPEDEEVADAERSGTRTSLETGHTRLFQLWPGILVVFFWC